MKTRSQVHIHFDNLWLCLFDAIDNNAKTIDIYSKKMIECLGKEYKKEVNSFVKDFEKIGESPPQLEIYPLERKDQQSGDTLLIRGTKRGEHKVVDMLLRHGASQCF